MKTSCILMSMSWALFASASPFGGPLEGANMRGLAKRASSSPSACRPPKHDFFIDNKNVNNAIKTEILGNTMNIVFPVVSGKTYKQVFSNVGNSKPVSTFGKSFASWNSNKYCSLVSNGASAVCNIPLASISGVQCGASDFFLSINAQFTSGSVGSCVGSCYSSSCLGDWTMFSIFRFDCSAAGGSSSTRSTTTTVTKTTTVTSSTTKVVTASTTKLTTTTKTVLGVPTSSVLTVTSLSLSTLTLPTIIPTIITIPQITTITVGGGVSLPSVSACPVATGILNSGNGVNILKTVGGLVSNLFSCTQVDLLTGTYGVLNIKNADGNLVRVGSALVKLNPDGTLYVSGSADAGYDLTSFGVSANCMLPSAITSPVGTVGSVAGTVGSVAGTVGGAAGGLVSTVGSTVGSLTGTTAGTVSGTTNVIGNAAGSLTGTAGSLSNAVGNAANNIVNAVGTALGGTTGVAGNTAFGVNSAITNAEAGLTGVGQVLTGGLTNTVGLPSTGNTVIGTTGNVVGGTSPGGGVIGTTTSLTNGGGVTGATNALTNGLGALGGLKTLFGRDGVSVNTCSTLQLCNVLGGLTDSSSSGLVNLGSQLNAAGTCVTGALSMAVIATVNKLVTVGQAC